MKIWWGWRLGFDCALLYAFLHYFAFCKYTTLLPRSLLTLRACCDRPNRVLEIHQDGASKMDSEEKAVPEQPLL